MPSHVTEVRLGELLMAASRTFSRQGQARFGEHGLSPARVRLLMALGDAEAVRMRDLAARLGVTGRAVTPLVDALEAEGLVRRCADPGDRRAFRLELTEAGTGALERIGELQARISREIFQTMDPGQRDLLARLLTTFLGDTPEALAGGTTECPPDER